jgi:hypothetical protein
LIGFGAAVLGTLGRLSVTWTPIPDLETAPPRVKLVAVVPERMAPLARGDLLRSGT